MSSDASVPEQPLLTGRSIRSGKNGAKTVKVSILGKEIQIGCTAADEQNLEKAARYVDTSMQESRARNKALPVEKIAIFTAINIANELLKIHAETEPDTALQEKLENLNRKLDKLIEPAKPATATTATKSASSESKFETATDS